MGRGLFVLAGMAEMRRGKLVRPVTLAALRDTPAWAKPLLEAALSLSDG